MSNWLWHYLVSIVGVHCYVLPLTTVQRLDFNCVKLTMTLSRQHSLVCIAMYCHGPPSFQTLDFDWVRLIVTVQCVLTYGVHCYALPKISPDVILCSLLGSKHQLTNCQGQPSFQRSDLDCAKLTMTVCQHAWCALYCCGLHVFHRPANSQHNRCVTLYVPFVNHPLQHANRHCNTAVRWTVDVIRISH